MAHKVCWEGDFYNSQYTTMAHPVIVLIHSNYSKYILLNILVLKLQPILDFTVNTVSDQTIIMLCDFWMWNTYVESLSFSFFRIPKAFLVRFFNPGERERWIITWRGTKGITKSCCLGGLKGGRWAVQLLSFKRSKVTFLCIIDCVCFNVKANSLSGLKCVHSQNRKPWNPQGKLLSLALKLNQCAKRVTRIA